MAIPPAYVYRALRRYASKVGWPVMYVYVPDWATYVRTRLPTPYTAGCFRVARRDGSLALEPVLAEDATQEGLTTW